MSEPNTQSQSPADAALARALSKPQHAAAQDTVDESRTEAERARARSASAPTIVDGTVPQTPADAQHAVNASRGCPYHAPGYEMLRKLGAGTFGEVWHARELATGIEVAVKFVCRGTDARWQTLQTEVAQLARLNADPGVIRLMEVNADAQPPYFVMAYADNGCLAKRLKQGPLPVREALGLFRDVAQTLAYVHAKGIRHCDLKPGNVLLDALGKARVADFGQAHLCGDATPALGTYFYMAPEQAELKRQEPDPRWDVYALGALFFAMVVGAPPRRGEAIEADLRQPGDLPARLKRYREWVRAAPPPREHYRVPGVDRGLATLIDRCLAVDPAQRPADARAVLDGLAAAEQWRRHRLLRLAAVALPVVAVLIVFWIVLGYVQAEQQARKSLDLVKTELGQSDRAAARLVAYKVKELIGLRANFVERHAEDSRLRAAAVARDDAAAHRLLNEYYTKKTAHEPVPNIVAIALYHADGKGAALVPDQPAISEEEFRQRDHSTRDYFHGLGQQDSHGMFPPVKATYVSQPFQGRSTRGELVLGVSAPVLSPDGSGKVVGVLMVTFKFERLNEWLKDVQLGDGFVTLFNNHKQVFKHRDMDAVHLKVQGNVKAWDCELYDHVLGAEEPGYTVFTDPVDHKEYLAGFAPIDFEGFRWGVLVQHEYAGLEKPVTDLQAEMFRGSLVSHVPTVALILMLGVWVVWALRRQERAQQIT
jgi:hypothetical protein